jgi:hypothetical protein
LVRTDPGLEELAQTSERDDYWTRRFGTLMTPDQLRTYWAIDPHQRFEYQSVHLLELCLRERLLDDSGAQLTQRQLDAYAAQPDLDACQAFLAALDSPEDR